MGKWPSHLRILARASPVWAYAFLESEVKPFSGWKTGVLADDNGHRNLVYYGWKFEEEQAPLEGEFREDNSKEV